VERLNVAFLSYEAIAITFIGKDRHELKLFAFQLNIAAT